VGVVTTFAFAHVFTFLQWDEEGHFLQAYPDFLSGDVGYDQVFAMYGPFIFFSAALLARFDAINVSTTTSAGHYCQSGL
jgi:hypothetical protein